MIAVAVVGALFAAVCVFWTGLHAGQAIYDRHDRALLIPAPRPIPAPPGCAHCGPSATPKVATW